MQCFSLQHQTLLSPPDTSICHWHMSLRNHKNRLFFPEGRDYSYTQGQSLRHEFVPAFPGCSEIVSTCLSPKCYCHSALLEPPLLGQLLWLGFHWLHLYEAPLASWMYWFFFFLRSGRDFSSQLVHPPCFTDEKSEPWDMWFFPKSYAVFLVKTELIPRTPASCIPHQCPRLSVLQGHWHSGMSRKYTVGVKQTWIRVLSLLAMKPSKSFFES